MSNDAPFIRPVPQILPGTALTVSTGKPRGSLSFPAAGGVQAIDETGAVLDLAGAGGAVTATVTDAVTNAASTALSLVHALSAGVGANGIGVTQRFLLPNSLGVSASAGQFTVSYTDATSGSEDSALGITLQVGGAGTGVLTLSAPTAGATTLTAAGSASASLNLVGAGGIAIAPTAVASGLQTALTVTGNTNAAVTLASEQIDVNVNLARTVTWASGAGPLGTQRAFSIAAPTYAGNVVNPLVISDAVTLFINSAPVDGANLSITRNHALWVATGLARFDGGIGQTAANTGDLTCLTVQRAVNLAAAGADDIGGTLLFSAPNTVSDITAMGFVTGHMTTATAGAEVAYLSLGGASLGTNVEALRLLSATGSVVTKVSITPGTTGVAPVITGIETGAGSANSGLIMRSVGTGSVSLQGSGAANIVAVDTTGGVSRLGFFNVTPLIRQTVANCVPAADGTSAGTQLNALLASLRLFGLLT